jgi:hypothetical protein
MMRKILLGIKHFLLVFVALFSLSETSCLAQQIEGYGGFVFATSTEHSRNGIGFDAGIDYKIRNPLKLRTSIGGYIADVQGDVFIGVLPSPTRLRGNQEFGEYRMLWFEESILVHRTISIEEAKWHSYIGFGFGYHYLDPTGGDGVAAINARGLIPGEELDDVLSFHIKSGLEIPLSQKLSLNIGGKYLFLNSTYTLELYEHIGDPPALNTKQVNLSTFMFNLTLSYQLF